VTRPSYDPMRAPAPHFPRARFQRIHDDDTVNALAEAYDALSYEERVRFAHQVTSAPDERLREIADELASADQDLPPVQPVPAGAPEAPAVNQAAAQVNPDAALPPGAVPDGTQVTGPADTPDAATTAGADTSAGADAATPTAEQPAAAAAEAPAGGQQPEPPTAPAAAPTPPPLPVPPDQLSQLRVPELQEVAEQVGVPKSGTKQELVDRITAATGEQAAITPDQVAADAASAPQSPADAAPQADTPADAAGAPTEPQTAPPTPAAPADGTPTDGGQQP
jgi:hypothetical protein